MIIKNISGKLIGINGELVLPDDTVTVDDSIAMLPSIMVMANAKMVEFIAEPKTKSAKEKIAEPVVVESEPIEEMVPEDNEEPIKEETVKSEEPAAKKTTSTAKKKTTTAKKTTATTKSKTENA